MSGYYIRSRSNEDVIAEVGTAIVVAGVIAAAIAVGALAAQLGSAIVEVYADHGQPGQPAALRLRRAWQYLAGVWGAAALSLLLEAPAPAALLLPAAGVSTIVYVLYVLVLGRRLAGEPHPESPVGDLDTYLSGFEPSPAAATVQPVAQQAVPALRLVHTAPRNGVRNGTHAH